jgi:hypothetical protein
MRGIIVALVCAGWLTTTQAQSVAKVIMPTPVSVALTIGKWLMQDSKKLYYIEVESRAETFFQAKNEGFRLATEHALGSLVLSESHVTNGRLSRDEIITYSSGYVDNFEIVQRDDVAGGVILKMKVWVAHSAIANRLLNQSTKDGQVEGERVATQIATLNHQRQSGDRLLSTVLSDFPHRAFDIKLDKTKVVYTNQRTAQLYVGFYINWNINYLNSMAEALTAINQRTQCGLLSRQVHCQGSYQVEIARPGFSRNTRTYFDDDVTGRMFQDQVWNKRPGIVLTLRDFNGNQLSKQCYPNFHMIWNYINFEPGKNITVRGDYVKWMDTYVDLTGLPVERLDKVEITVVSGHGCN